MQSVCRIAALAGALAVMPAAVADEIVYKWVDDGGITHYAQQPPVGVEAQRLNPGDFTSPPHPAEQDGDAKTSAADDPGGGSGDDSSDDQDSDPATNHPDSIAEYCTQMRQRVKALAGDAAVSVRQEDGSLKMLDGEARAQQIKEGRAQIARNCSDSSD